MNYLDYISNEQIERFIRFITKQKDAKVVIVEDPNARDSLKVFTSVKDDYQFFITDFDCINLTDKASNYSPYYTKGWRKFASSVLQKENLSDKYGIDLANKMLKEKKRPHKHETDLSL